MVFVSRVEGGKELLKEISLGVKGITPDDNERGKGGLRIVNLGNRGTSLQLPARRSGED